MSKANPYDQEMSPRKRLISNITFALTTLLVIGFVIWTLASQPEKVRTNFDYTAGSFHSLQAVETPMDEPPVPPDDDILAANELYRLCLAANEGPLAWNADFRESYPTAASLLQPEDGVFESQKPTVCESDACISLGMCAADGGEKGIRRLDILTVPYSAQHYDNKQSVVLYAPRSYTLVYDTQTGLVEAQAVRVDNFRLYYYSLALTLQQPAGLPSLSYAMTLNGVISDKEADKGDLFHRLAAQPSVLEDAQLTRQSDTSLLTGDGTFSEGTNQAILTLQFNDFMYDAFSSIRFTWDKAEGQEENAQFQISFNRSDK